jgi:hypothetical protein
VFGGIYGLDFYTDNKKQTHGTRMIITTVLVHQILKIDLKIETDSSFAMGEYTAIFPQHKPISIAKKGDIPIDNCLSPRLKLPLLNTNIATTVLVPPLATVNKTG